MTDPSESFATPRVAAGALFVDERGRILLVHPTYKDTWDIPGGYVEQGESPAAACQREVKEELGLDRRPLCMINIDWAPSDHQGDKLLFLFDCGPLGSDEERIRLDGVELDQWKRVEVDNPDQYAIPRITCRVLTALATPNCTYLERGQATA